MAIQQSNEVTRTFNHQWSRQISRTPSQRYSDQSIQELCSIVPFSRHKGTDNIPSRRLVVGSASESTSAEQTVKSPLPSMSSDHQGCTAALLELESLSKQISVAPTEPPSIGEGFGIDLSGGTEPAILDSSIQQVIENISRSIQAEETHFAKCPKNLSTAGGSACASSSSGAVHTRFGIYLFSNLLGFFQKWRYKA